MKTTSYPRYHLAFIRDLVCADPAGEIISYRYRDYTREEEGGEYRNVGTSGIIDEGEYSGNNGEYHDREKIAWDWKADRARSSLGHPLMIMLEETGKKDSRSSVASIPLLQVARSRIVEIYDGRRDRPDRANHSAR